jgi:hypothetical protein
MNRYKITKQLGDGTYGSVLKAVNRTSGEVVSFVAKQKAAQTSVVVDTYQSVIQNRLL